MDKNQFIMTLLFIFYIKLYFSNFFTRQIKSKSNEFNALKFINEFNNFFKNILKLK